VSPQEENRGPGVRRSGGHGERRTSRKEQRDKAWKIRGSRAQSRPFNYETQAEKRPARKKAGAWSAPKLNLPDGRRGGGDEN